MFGGDWMSPAWLRCSQTRRSTSRAFTDEMVTYDPPPPVIITGITARYAEVTAGQGLKPAIGLRLRPGLDLQQVLPSARSALLTQTSTPPSRDHMLDERHRSAAGSVMSVARKSASCSSIL